MQQLRLRTAFFSCCRVYKLFIMIQPEVILNKVLVNVAAEQNLQDHDFLIKPISSGGANFMSILHKIVISSPNRQDLKLFAKLGTLPEIMRQHMPIEIIYKLEMMVYTKVVPAFEAIQENHNIPDEERYKFPKYYSANLVKNEEAIILEDLVEQGYTMYDRCKPVNWEYAAKVVEELAKFHALSLGYNKEFPDEVKELHSQYNSSMEFIYSSMKGSIIQMAKSTISVAPDNMKQRLENFIINYVKRENMMKYNSPSKFGFLVHGDFRASNILFKRKGGKIKHLIPVDYQAVHPGSPAIDLLYFIYSGTDEEFRRLHLNQLLDHYYSTLSNFISRIDIEGEQVYSRKDFDEEYENMLGHGLRTAIMLLPIVLAPQENAPDLGKGMLSFGETKSGDNFRERIMPILNDFVKWGIL